MLFLSVTPQQHEYIGRFAVGFLASWWIWAVLSPLTRMAARRVPLERPWMRPAALHLFFAIAAALLFAAWFSWTLWITRAPTLPPEPYAVEFRRFVMGHLAAGVAIYATIVAVSTTIDERAERRRRELETARLAADLAQAQLRALQMQLQPHFLFNTLHSIAMLTDTDPAAAETMAVKLAELLRTTLRLRDVTEVPLRTELELLRAYLEIEELRFKEHLRVTFAIPDELLDLAVPSFLLQPIVENAVRHGVSKRVESGRILVAATREPDALVLSVEDNGPGFDGDPFESAGVGLSATRDRLLLRYGATASIICESRDVGARVTLRIPLDGARAT